MDNSSAAKELNIKQQKDYIPIEEIIKPINEINKIKLMICMKS